MAIADKTSQCHTHAAGGAVDISGQNANSHDHKLTPTKPLSHHLLVLLVTFFSINSMEIRQVQES